MRRRDLLRLAAAMPAALAARGVNSQPAPAITRAAVVIGVDAPQGLPKLHAAASGAKLVSDWLTNEGFEVALLTDGATPVRVADIFKAIDDFVSLTTVEQLVIYFAGHGSVVGYGEFWLLSEAPHNPNEAVSLSETFDLARACGIPNVVFISDACRSTAESLGAQHVRGQLIFANDSGNTRVATKIDRFLATGLGSPAYEVKDTAGVYNGIYTSSFLDGYKDPYVDTVKEVNGLLVVPNQSMEPYLSKIVPQRASTASSKIDQAPSSIIESRPEVYIGKAAKVPSPGRSLESIATFATINHVVGQEFKNIGFEIGASPASVNDTDLQQVAADTGFARSRDLILSARGPSVFKYGTGMNVFGAGVRSVATSANIHATILHSGDGRLDPTIIQIDPRDDRQGTVVIELDDGSGTALAGLREFVANIVVDGTKVINVSYVPGGVGEQLRSAPSDFPQLDQLHALVASSAKFGVFQIDGPPELRARNAQRLANTIRAGKLIDPTLGIYAAYAYADAGLSDQVRSVYQIMKADGIELFDVAMLAGAISGSPRLGFPTPSCPMLTQGWGLLRAKAVSLPEQLVNSRDHLLSGLWTTFDPEGLQTVRPLFTRA